MNLLREQPSTESRTRDRVLRAISEHGPVTASALAERLGLTATAVRRHLDLLEDAGHVETRADTTRRGPGRPARAYVLSDAGHRALTADYDHLAAEALRFLRDAAGQEAVAAFARERMAGLAQRYAVEVDQAGDDVPARVDALVRALRRDGFAPSARPVEGPGPFTGVQLCQGHCPVQHVAREFPQFCEAETEAFSALLGVHVQRLATLAQGDHVCTTFIPAGAGLAEMASPIPAPTPDPRHERSSR